MSWVPTLEKYDYAETTLDGGINTSLTSDKIENSESPSLSNVVAIRGRLQPDTGYTTFGPTVRGTPQTFLEWTANDGTTIVYFLITTAAWYLYDTVNAVWNYAPDVKTTLNANFAGGVSAVTVASIAGIVNGRHISIVLDSGGVYFGTVNGVPSGSTINITPVLTSAASSGNSLRQAVDLTGSLDLPANIVPWPAQDYLIVCNSVDPISYYSPLTGLVAHIPDLPTNTTARSIAVFHELLLIGNTVENGTYFPFRLRRSDQADITNWTTGISGLDDLLDTDDPIYNMLPLAGWLIIYRFHSIMRVTYLGLLDNTFFIEYMNQGEGIISFKAVADMDDKHFVFGNTGIYTYEGGYILTPISDDIFYTVFDQVRGNINLPYAFTRTWCTYIRATDDVLAFYPAGSNHLPDTTLRWNRADETWHIRTFADQMIGSGLFYNNIIVQILLCSGTAGQVYVYDYSSTTDNSTSITWSFSTKQFGSEVIKSRTNRLMLTGIGTVSIAYATDRSSSFTSLGNVSLGSNALKLDVWFQTVFQYIQFKITGTESASKQGVDYLSLEYQEESLW